MRLLLVGLSFHVSGFVHDAVDAATVIAVGADLTPDDDDGMSGDCDCPAGCPMCHCCHGVGSLPQCSSTTEFVLLMGVPEVSDVPYEAASPPVPELRSLYRPPRFLPRSA
jgi:hypothetical protein